MRPGGGAGAGGAIVNIASVAATIAFPAIASLIDFIVVTRRCLPGGAAAGGRACCSSSADKKLSADRNERLDGAGVLPALPPRVQLSPGCDA
jgi:hypothetical protein